jgi:hypothetical protein
VRFDDWDQCRDGKLLLRMTSQLKAESLADPYVHEPLVAFLLGETEEVPDGFQVGTHDKHSFGLNRERYGPVKHVHWSAGFMFVAGQ